MHIETTTIRVNALRIYAYHGVLPQERTDGNDYLVDIELRVNHALPAVFTDNVDDTINYATLVDIARAEMAVPSDLLEHVAARIAASICNLNADFDRGTVTVTKCRPPYDCESDGASVTLQFRKN